MDFFFFITRLWNLYFLLFSTFLYFFISCLFKKNDSGPPHHPLPPPYFICLLYWFGTYILLFLVNTLGVAICTLNSVYFIKIFAFLNNALALFSLTLQIVFCNKLLFRFTHIYYFFISFLKFRHSSQGRFSSSWSVSFRNSFSYGL